MLYAAMALRHAVMPPRERIVPFCNCYRCEERRAIRKRRKYMRDTGRPSLIYPHEFDQAVRKLLKYRDGGMTRFDMATGTGLSDGSFADWMNGVNKTMNRRSYDRIMAMQYVSTDSPMGARVDASGTTRRIQALRCAGWPTKTVLGPTLGMALGSVGKLSNGNRAFVFYHTREKVREVYDKLINVDPLDYGVTEFDARRARIWAYKAGCVPAHCWDEDTIDDPDAYPEWTGECGTVTGYFIHLKQDILVEHGPKRTDTGKPRRTVLCDVCCKARRGAKKPTSRADQNKIWAAIQRGDSYDVITEEFKCSTRTIARIKRERSQQD